MQIEDFPLTLSARDVATIMGISLNSAYVWIRRPGFPRVINGRHLLVPRDAFWSWYNMEAIKDGGETRA